MRPRKGSQAPNFLQTTFSKLQVQICHTPKPISSIMNLWKFRTPDSQTRAPFIKPLIQSFLTGWGTGAEPTSHQVVATHTNCSAAVPGFASLLFIASWSLPIGFQACSQRVINWCVYKYFYTFKIAIYIILQIIFIYFYYTCYTKHIIIHITEQHIYWYSESYTSIYCIYLMFPDI